MPLFDRALITTSTEIKNGFTVPAHPGKWGAVGTAKEEAKPLLIRRLRFLGRAELGDALGEVEGVATVLTAVLHHESQEPRQRAVAALCAEGMVLHPYGATPSKNRFFAPNLIADKSFLPAFDEIIDTPLDRHARRALSLLWLSTIEGRTRPRNRETVEQWIAALMSPDRSQSKWIAGMGPLNQANLLALGAAFRVLNITNKFRPTRAILESPQLQEWKQAYEVWINEKHLASTSGHWSAFALLAKYLSTHPECLDPFVFFRRSRDTPTLVAWAQPLTQSRALRLRRLEEFFHWFAVHKELGVLDEWTRQLTLRAGLVWPFSSADAGAVNMSLQSRQRPGQSVQLSLPLEYILKAEEILLADDMAWPKTRREDWITDDNGARVFCPVLPIAILVLLKLPARSTQVRRLDSGEGDCERFNMATRTWEPNYGPHSGYWKQRGVKNTRRGVLRKIRDTWTGSDLCGFYINSNKTSDRKVLFSEDSGYEISWQFDDVIALFSKMRVWQEQYNAVSGPLPFAHVRPSVFETPTETVEKRRPEVFYLFRYPAGRFGDFRESPPSSQQLRMYWLELLAELERRLASTMSEPPKFIDSWLGNSPQASAYGLHGLRVAGLTRLAVAGVHPWILQNVVAGHAKFVMTLYYVKVGAVCVSQELNEGHARAMADRQHEFAQFLSTGTMEKVRKLALAAGADGFTDLERVRGRGAVMAKMDNGICPNGRTRCSEGVRLQDRTESKHRELRSVYGPVPSTVGGAPDCCRCRFFITGTPFIDGMRIRANEVSYAAYKSSQRQQQLLKRIDEIEERRSTAERLERGQLVISDQHELSTLQQELKAETDVLCNLAESLHAHGELFQQIRTLLNEAGKGEPGLIVAEDISGFKWGLVPRFDALDELCRNARWFKAVRDENLQRERREMVHKLLARSGRPSLIAHLSHTEVDIAINEFTADLRRRLNSPFIGPLIESGAGVDPRLDEVLSEAITALSERTAAIRACLSPSSESQSPAASPLLPNGCADAARDNL